MSSGITVREIIANINEGKSKVVDIIEASLSKVRRFNKRSNAFITVFENDSLERAAALDERIAEGKPVGGLCGVPVGIKDNIWVRSYPTTAGTKLFENFVPKKDAKIVARLKRLGSVILGKNNLHALALGATSTSSLFGPVRNPRDESRTAGGSSGGTAAAIAQGMVACGVGTDTGGSVRIPAAFCGLTGYKPTYGLISLEGVMPLSYTLDHVGLLTNTVQDCYLLYKLLTRSSAVKIDQFPSDTSLAPEGSIKLGLPKEYCTDLDPKVESDFHEMLEKLKSHGLKVVDIRLPDPSEVHKARSIIMLKEASTLYSEALSRVEAQFPPDVMNLLVIGRSTKDEAYVDALRFRAKAMTQLLEALSRVDFIVMPTMPIVAPKLDDVLGNESGPIRLKLVRNTGLFNLTGLPSVAFPIDGKNGLFTSFQLATTPVADERLLRVGVYIESLRA